MKVPKDIAASLKSLLLNPRTIVVDFELPIDMLEKYPLEQWMIDAATQIVEVMRYAQKHNTHYSDREEIAGISSTIHQYYYKSKRNENDNLELSSD